MPPKKKPVPALLTAEHVPFNEQGLPESKDFTNLTKNQAAFLKAYIRFGSITNAARAVNMCREIFYHWMRPNDDGTVSQFEHAYNAAEQMRIERAEAALQWRAVDGWLEPVFYRGKVVGHVRYFSDDLLKFFLRHNKPGKYIEKKEIQVGNTDGKPFVVRSAEPVQVIDWQATVQAEMAPPNDEEDVP